MPKNKYQRASKEIKKKARDEYFKTEFGVSLKKRLNRLVIYSALLLGFAIYLVIDNMLGDNSVSVYVFAGFLAIFAGIFVYGRHYVIVRNINDYMLSNKRYK